MTANIENMAYRGQVPWHGLGNTLTDGMTLDQELAACGLNWSVLDSPVIYRVGNEPMIAEDKRLFYRSDMPEKVLGVMSNQFKPVQPRECLEFFHAFSDEMGVTLETAGVLGDGSKYWALAKTGESVTIGDSDRTDDYILIATANDGSMSTRIGPNRIRVVCQNTLNAALSQSDHMMTINHRSKVDWNKTRKWLEGERQGFALYGDLMQALSLVPVSTEQATDYACELIAPEWNRKGKAPNKLKSFANTLNNGVGQSLAGPTAYGLLNAVTRHVDHERRARSVSTRMDSAWFGAGASLKSQALDKLLSDCVDKWGHSELVPIVRETIYA